MLTTNYSFPIINEGLYKATITKTKSGVSINGLPKVMLFLDVKVGDKTLKIVDTIWTAMEESVEYKFNIISKALGFDEGLEYKDLNDWLKVILDEPLMIDITIETFEGKERNQIIGYSKLKDSTEK